MDNNNNNQGGNSNNPYLNNNNNNQGGNSKNPYLDNNNPPPRNDSPKRPGRADDINMNIPNKPQTNDPVEPPIKKNETIKQQVDYGVDLEKINVVQPGEMLFNDENGQRISTYSSHDSVLSNSTWQTVHRAMNKRFDDPNFNLDDKRKCLYSKSGRG